MHSEWEYVYETPWNATRLDDLNCAIDRPNGDWRGLSIFNHFVNTRVDQINSDIVYAVPSRIESRRANTLGNLRKHMETCPDDRPKPLNVVSVDFYTETNDGDDIFEFVAEINGVVDQYHSDLANNGRRTNRVFPLLDQFVISSSVRYIPFLMPLVPALVPLLLRLNR